MIRHATTRRPTALVAAFAVATIFCGSRNAYAVEDEPTYKPVQVQSVIARQHPARTKRLQPALAKAGTDALESRYGVEVVDGADTTVVFRVRGIDVDAETRADTAAMNYFTSVEVHRGGETIAEEIMECPEMDEAAVVECVLSGIPPMLEHLPQQEVVAPPDDTPPPDQPPPDQPPPDDTKPRVAPLTWVGSVGIGLAAGGVGLSIGGIAYLARGDERQSPSQTATEEFDDYRPTGRTLLGVGVGVAVVGVVMLAVDASRQAKKRKERQTKVGFGAGRGFAGLTVRGRF